MSCFLEKEFGEKNYGEYLEELLKKRETRISNHRRWRALCKEEKTNFKSIFNETKYRMTAKNKPTFDAIQNIQEDRDNLKQMMLREDKLVEHTLCQPEGFLLGGLPEQLDVLLELERVFMGFDFEDQRPRIECDLILDELELCFGRKLRKSSDRAKLSFFDLIVLVRSQFEKLVRTRLSKFESVENGRQVDLDFMHESDKEFVAEFVNKIRVDDNVYALPSKFHSNLKSLEAISKMYQDNFKGNGDFEAFGQKNNFPQLVLVIDDEEDLAISVRKVEERLDAVMACKEAFYQKLLISTEQEEELVSLECSKKIKRENHLSQKSNVEDEHVKVITGDFFRELQEASAHALFPKSSNWSVNRKKSRIWRK